MERDYKRFRVGNIYDIPESIAALWYQKEIALPEGMSNRGVDHPYDEDKIQKVVMPKRDKKQEKMLHLRVNSHGEVTVQTSEHKP